MSVSDAILISNLIGKKNFESLPDKEKVFADVQSGYLLDTNAATGGVINFDTKILENSMIDYANAYIQAPLAIVSSTATAYTANTKIAFKSSALSLITALNTQIAERTVLNTTVGLMFVNHIRKLLEHNDDWQKSEGAQLHFAKDDNVRTNSDDTRKYLRDASGFWAPNVNYNAGFAERVARLVGNVNWQNNQFAGVALDADTSLTGSSAPTTGALNFHATADGTKPGFRTTVQIPLRHIHDFYDSLKFPIVNARMLLQFTLEFASSNLFRAFQVGYSSGTTSHDPPTVSIQPNQTCRLYYRKVTLPPTVGSIVANMLKQGLTKKFTYLEADVFVKRLANSAQTIDDEISTSIRRPVRVFMLQYTAGAVRSCISYEPSHTACSASVENDGYSSANIMINNQNYYNQPLDNTFSQWSEFKNQMINQDDRSSLLKYSDYLGRHRNMLCFDLSHLKERMANPDQACAIQLNVVRNGTPYSSDFITVVEREVEFQITMSTGAVEVSSGVRL